MNLFSKAIKRFKEKLYREVKQQVINEVKEEFPSPSTYLQDYQETDIKTGRETHVSYKTLEMLYKKESWVRAGIDVIMRTATSKGFRIVADKDADLTSVDKNKLAKLKSLFEGPNAEDTFNDLVAEAIIDSHLYGDAYWEIAYDSDGLPGALYNVYCPSIRILVDEHGVVKGYVQLRGGWGSSEIIPFKKDQMTHFKMHNPGNEVYGLSPLESLALPIETDLYAQAYNRDFFKNDATPRLHVDMGNCTIDQLRRNREYWKTQFRGMGNPHKTIITEGGAKVNPIGTPPKDMEFLNQRKFSREEILGVLGVPPIKVGITETSNRSNSKEQDKAFKTEKIIPLQKYLAEKINKEIISKFGVPYKFEFIELDLEDAIEQARIDEIDLKNGVVTINEIRRKRGLSEKPWGDRPLVRENLMPLTIGQSSEEEESGTIEE